MSKRGRKPDPNTPYKMWLCYHLACTVDEGEELPMQDIVAYDAVGDPMGLSGKSVAGHSSKARKLFAAEAGINQYHEWLNNRERMWWCYRLSQDANRNPALAVCVGSFSGDKATRTYLTRAEFDEYVNKARTQLEQTGARGKHDYDRWLLVYEQRDLIGRSMPVIYRELCEGSPEAIAMDNKRIAKGLLIRIKSRGRRPKRHRIK